jgi:hypothetical protein
MAVSVTYSEKEIYTAVRASFMSAVCAKATVTKTSNSRWLFERKMEYLVRIQPVAATLTFSILRFGLFKPDHQSF